MQTLLKFSQAIDKITDRLGQASAICVVLTIAIGFYNVVARYLGRFIGVKLTSNLFIELLWYLFSLTFLLGFSYVLKHGLNVRVDFLYANWSPKTKAWVDLIGHAIFLTIFCIIGIYVTAHPVLQSWGQLPDGTFGAWELSPDPFLADLAQRRLSGRTVSMTSATLMPPPCMGRTQHPPSQTASANP